MALDFEDRKVWALTSGPLFNITESGYFGICELMRVHSHGLTVKEQVYVQERLDTISEALSELRIITTRTKRSS